MALAGLSGLVPGRGDLGIGQQAGDGRGSFVFGRLPDPDHETLQRLRSPLGQPAAAVGGSVHGQLRVCPTVPVVEPDRGKEAAWRGDAVQVVGSLGPVDGELNG